MAVDARKLQRLFLLRLASCLGLAGIIGVELLQISAGRAQSSLPGGTSLLPPFSLAGTIISPTVRRALVARANPERLEPATEGQEIEGWKFEKILADRVVLLHQSARVELQLRAPFPSAMPPLSVAKAAEPPPAPPEVMEPSLAGPAAYFTAHGVEMDEPRK